MKICRKCNTEKQKSDFYKQGAAKDGLQSSCKSCVTAYNSVSAQRDRNIAKLNAYFVDQSHRPSLREKHAAKDRARYAANKDKYKEANRKSREANREKYNAMMRTYLAAYREVNPEKMAAYRHNRRSREVNAEGTHTAADIKAIFSAQGGLCANCNARLFKSGKQKYHVDHIVPLVRGGSNDKYNLQCLCPGCNVRKQAIDPIDWAQRNGRLL